MNRKERRLALRTAFSSRAEDLMIVEEFGEQLPQPKTKELVSAFSRWGIESGDKVLLILPEIPNNIYLSGRNLSNLKLIRADSLNVYDVLAADKIVATSAALAKIQEVYSD
jgi:large subunit ribosomal protein L4